VRCDNCGECRHVRMRMRDYKEKKRLALRGLLERRRTLLIEINERLRGESHE
jgi:hypothetical protein